MKQKTIGIFDSGIGGLTVLYEAMRRLPGERFLFDADTEHAPYGTKEEAQVGLYAEAQVRFLLEEGAEGIVVACNTATAVAIEDLRAKYHVPLVGMEPAVKPALQMAVGQRVLVLATPITVREKNCIICSKNMMKITVRTLLPCPGWSILQKEKSSSRWR
ncbi:MAG: aspartate/glutamate racemase family protein [Lachnospiraceae bacterium]|nr:aspartate/glutamate racemase family protein [Lachnospiraceae bacterium]